MPTGRFITFEGGEGAGKSTQARLLAERLAAVGRDPLLTREPGGSQTAEAIREFLLSGQAEEFGAMGEAVLFAVAREDHLDETIRPALERGQWVICDRFADSTRAYQGTGGAKPDALQALERLTVGTTRPDLTVILDLPPEEGLARAGSRTGANGGTAVADAFEARSLEYHLALRQAFLAIAAEEPDRCVVIDATRPVEMVAEDVWRVVETRLLP